MLKFSPVRLISCQQGDLGRKIVELGLKSCVNYYESWSDWKNYDSNLESWVDDWKNCDHDWDAGSDLTLSGHCILAP